MVPYIRPEIFPNQLLPYWLDILGTPARVVIPILCRFKAIDQQTIRTTYSNPVWSVFRIKNGKIKK
jgi:hypothetical protein